MTVTTKERFDRLQIKGGDKALVLFIQRAEFRAQRRAQQFPLEYFFFYFHIFTQFKKIIFRKISIPKLRL